MPTEKPIEKMNDFFTGRAAGYDEHMLRNVPGCAEGYRRMAGLVPVTAKTLLDLGCGTGLELEEIFKRLPGLQVTGVDMTPAMLKRLRAKFPDRDVTLLCEDYFSCSLGSERFDAAVSFESLHHYTHAEKAALYARLLAALRPGGVYIECDYMVASQQEEDHWSAEARALRAAQGALPGQRLHYDTPCTVDNQLMLLKGAGFAQARQVWREENTTLLVAHKAT